jgi:hypothetical protein
VDIPTKIDTFCNEFNHWQSSARINEALTKHAAVEKIDAVGSDAMFGDKDIK